MSKRSGIEEEILSIIKKLSDKNLIRLLQFAKGLAKNTDNQKLTGN